MDEDDKKILELEYLYSQRSKPIDSDRGPATFSISQALWRKLYTVYGKTRSDKIEEDLIARLRREGKLPPPTQASKVGGGAHAYFNIEDEGTATDSYMESPFKEESSVGKILKEQAKKPTKQKPKK